MFGERSHPPLRDGERIREGHPALPRQRASDGSEAEHERGGERPGLGAEILARLDPYPHFLMDFADHRLFQGLSRLNKTCQRGVVLGVCRPAAARTPRPVDVLRRGEADGVVELVGGVVAEQIQREFPEVKVVKSLNTMNAVLMVNPALLLEDHHTFISGNDPEAKVRVKELLKAFGWKERNIVDMGDISSARGLEQVLPLWVRLFGTLKTPMFNFKIVIADPPKG